MTEVVGATHRFHDTEYAEDWARRFNPTAERLHLFETILQQLKSRVPPAGHVVELGIGPAYLAEYLLTRLPQITYEGVDFSQPMLTQAASRLKRFSARLNLQQADLLGQDWSANLARPPAAIVSTWALHDLGGQAQTAQVYRACATALPGGGTLLNGDFVKPEDTLRTFEPGRFSVSRHLELLREAEFSHASCLGLWEEEVDAPTSAQNYACLLATL